MEYYDQCDPQERQSIGFVLQATLAILNQLTKATRIEEKLSAILYHLIISIN